MFAPVHESASGPFETCRDDPRRSARGGGNVDIEQTSPAGPFLTDTVEKRF